MVKMQEKEQIFAKNKKRYYYKPGFVYAIA